MILIAYRRIRSRSEGLAMLELDTETGIAKRLRQNGEHIDNVGLWSEEGFRIWATQTYPETWSLDLTDAYWIKNSSYFIDVGL